MMGWRVTIHNIWIVEAETIDDAIEQKRKELVQQLTSGNGKYAFSAEGPLTLKRDVEVEK